jgi:hypothetical protein
MNIGGNDGIAAKLLPAFAMLAGILSTVAVVLWIWDGRALILAWTSSHILWTGIIFSCSGFLICGWLALFGSRS